MTSIAARSSIDQLTSLRGIAAWFVVFYHLRRFLVPYLPETLINVVSYGNLAVDMFFVLSGFVIYLNYCDRVSISFQSMRSFMKKRFARIYPLHAFILLIYGAYGLSAHLYGSEFTSSYQPGYFIASIFLVQNWGFLNQLAWNVPAWSISVEFAAYLLFPFLLAMLALHRRSNIIIFALIIFMMTLLYLSFWWLDADFAGGIPWTGIPRCLTQFSIGMCLSEFYRRGLMTSKSSVPALVLVISCVLALSVQPETPVVPLLWCAIIWWMCGWQHTNWLQWKPLVYIGEVSYATYLSHYLLLTLTKLVFVDASGIMSEMEIIFYLVAVAISSVLLYHFVERPAQSKLLSYGRTSAIPRPGESRT
ncbi:acyltransferase [Pacificimonas sp. WHA3]|uniref:Acyltransferase n=1 Tax=Pacificimonas pallii TaxID=2827236 RepID=A0ABS6SDG8_9SPHN|nr:acyltransferase [Pacificimonas pallii]